MIGSEEDFVSSMGAERALALLDGLQQAQDQARRIAATNGFVEGRTEPAVAFDLAVGALGGFENMDGVEHRLVKGQHLWIIDDQFGVRVKRLKSDYRTMNHPSLQQQLIDQQLPLDGLRPLTYLSTGPRISRSTGLPIDFVVVKHHTVQGRAQQVEWVVDLAELAAGVAVSRTLQLPLSAPAVEPAGVAVRRPRGGRVDSSS